MTTCTSFSQQSLQDGNFFQAPALGLGAPAERWWEQKFSFLLSHLAPDISFPDVLGTWASVLAWCWIPQFSHSPHGLWQSSSFFAETAGQLNLHCNEPSLWCLAMCSLNAVCLFVCGTHSLFQVLHGCSLWSRFGVGSKTEVKSLQLWKLGTKANSPEAS